MKSESSKTKERRRGRKGTFLLIVLLLVVVGGLSWLSSLTPALKPWWRVLTQEGRRILGWEKGKVPPEEKRIREEVILKKMEEASAGEDWREFAPEYPRPKKVESLTGEEKAKALRNSQEYKAMEREFREYLKKREGLLIPDPPLPSPKEEPDLLRMRDRATERVMERLVGVNEKPSSEKPLEENLRLGIRGPLLTRRILERPPLPPVKVRVEAEIEMTVYVLPSGMVDRVVPLVRGDAELERAAVQYLKQWRFASIPKDQPQTEQWGTVPIKFKLQ